VANKRRISEEEAKQVGTTLRLDWTKVDLEQFRRGLEVELEHGVRDPETNVTNDDLTLTGKIARAHLKEFKDHSRINICSEVAKSYYQPAPEISRRKFLSVLPELFIFRRRLITQRFKGKSIK